MPVTEFGVNASFVTDPLRLGLLSVEQTLADYAALIAHLGLGTSGSGVEVGGGVDRDDPLPGYALRAACAAGKYSDQNAQTTCKDCAAGKFQDQTAQDAEADSQE